ncbi:MAG: PaaI family thioesterase [Pseudomonadales bacterium]
MTDDDPVPDPRADFFERFDDVPFHRYLGLRLKERRDGFARLRLEVGEHTPTGIGGSVNGGVIATLVDMAVLPAVFTGMREGSLPAGTADLQVTYLRQAHGTWLDAEATVIKRGRQLCAVEVSVRNDDGVLCARARVLYALRSGST